MRAAAASCLPALEIAQTILAGFDKHYRLFREASAGARVSFELADWNAASEAAKGRIHMYDQRVKEATATVLERFPGARRDDALWQAIKLAYIGLLHNHKQPECAETFYNSVACKVLHRSYFHNAFIFWRPAVATEHIDSSTPTYVSHYPSRRGLRRCVRAVLEGFGLQSPFEDLQRDTRNLVAALRSRFPEFRAQPNFQIQVLASLFFRNKAAYAIGRAVNGNDEIPFAMPILRNERGELYVDALLTDADRFMVLFSFARAYFMVDMEVPSAYVSFLAALMPAKPRPELYTALGLQKHGKTLFYRDLHHHLGHSGDNFVTAPGIKGMVMLVFTLPSFPYVFKVIKDRFAPPKEGDIRMVREKYQLVKMHDRVGRMADTLEYSEVAFSLARIDPELLAELERECASNIEREGDSVIVKHLYIERRMIPLNMYLAEADALHRRIALKEYGDAIKQLASANIFPGDMLQKNFGVTRHERVVFYDYDEIVYMTDCKFRHIPQPRNPEEEMSAEPYYSVGPHDVFPEQFEKFLVTEPVWREEFMQHHADLMEPDMWAGKQANIRAGQMEDVFPYPEDVRFARPAVASDRATSSAASSSRRSAGAASPRARSAGPT